MSVDREKIIDALKTVYDPEIPVNVYDLGLIYDLNIDEQGQVKIVMTLTAPGCPLAEQLPEQVRQAVARVEGVTSVWVELTFDPPWSPERLSEEARIILELQPVKKPISALIIYLVVGIITYLLFLPYVQKTVSYANVAHIFLLNTLTIWDEVSPKVYHWAPVQTFPKAKKFNHYYKRLEDSEGNNYYVSHPPGAFVFTYFILKLFNLHPTQDVLQFVNVVLLLLMMAMIAYWLYRRLKHRDDFLLMYTSLLMLILSSGAVWYLFTQHLFAESWGLFFFAIWILLFDLWLKERNEAYAYALVATSALLAYADWMGLCVAVALLPCFFFCDSDRRKWIVFWVLVIGLVYLLVFWQYSSIAGPDKFLRALLIRFVKRSGFFGEAYTDMGYHVARWQTWKLLFEQILSATQGLLLLILLLVVYLKQRKFSFSILHGEQALWMAWMGVVLYTIAAFSATATHYVYVAKWAIPLVVTVVTLLANLPAFPMKISFVFVLLSIGLSVWGYFTFQKRNVPIDESKLNHLKAIATEVATLGKDTLDLTADLEERDIIYLSWASKRNLVWRKSQELSK